MEGIKAEILTYMEDAPYEIDDIIQYGDNKIEFACTSSEYSLSLSITKGLVYDLFIIKISDESIIRNVTIEDLTKFELLDKIKEELKRFEAIC